MTYTEKAWKPIDREWGAGKVRVDVKQSLSLPRVRAEALLKSAIAAVHQLEAQRGNR